MAALVVLLILNALYQGFCYQTALDIHPPYVSVGGGVTLDVVIEVNETSKVSFQVLTTNHTKATFRVVNIGVTSVGNGLRVSNTEPVINSSAQTKVQTRTNINFGQIVVNDPNNALIKIEAELQLVSADSGKANTEYMLGIGTTFAQKLIEVHECPVLLAVPSIKKPSLKTSVVLLEQDDNGVIWKDVAFHEISVQHAAATTDKALDVEITFEVPTSMQFKALNKDPSSVSLVTETSGGLIKVKANTLDFSDSMKFVVTHGLTCPSDVAVGSPLYATVMVTVTCHDSCSVQIKNDPVISQMKYYCMEFPPQDLMAPVPDKNLTASSFEPVTGEPKNARLNNDLAWTPASPWKTDKNQWFQVSLPSVSILTHMITQGAGKGLVSKSGVNGYVTSFLVYHSLNGVTWAAVYRDGSDKVFQSNKNSQGIVGYMFNPAITTQHVRINPKSWNQGIYLRMCLYGKPGNQAATSEKMFSRQMLLDKKTNTFFFCNVDYRRSAVSSKSSCFYTTGTTSTWVALDLRVLNLAGFDTVNRVIYGLDEKAKSVLSACLDTKPVSWYAIPVAELEDAKKKDAFEAPMSVRHIPKTNSTADKSTSEFVLTAADGTKWEAAAAGIFCNSRCVVDW